MTKAKSNKNKDVDQNFKLAFKHPNPYPKEWLPGPDGKRPIPWPKA